MGISLTSKIRELHQVLPAGADQSKINTLVPGIAQRFNSSVRSCIINFEKCIYSSNHFQADSVSFFSCGYVSQFFLPKPREGIGCVSFPHDLPSETKWRQTPRTPKKHTQTISYTGHQRRNENTGCMQGF